MSINLIILLSYLGIGTLQTIVIWFLPDDGEHEVWGIWKLVFNIGVIIILWPIVSFFLLEMVPEHMKKINKKKERTYLLTNKMIECYLEDDLEREEEIFQILWREKLIK